MPALFEITLSQFKVYFLITARMSGIFLIAPVIGSRNTPTLAKVGFSFFMALILYPIIKKPAIIPDELFTYAGMVIKEVAVGIIIGFFAILAFVAVQFAGHLMDLQIGFGIVNIIEPQSGSQVSLIAQFAYLFAILIFLLFNGHHILINAVMTSYDTVPLAGFVFKGKILESLNAMTTQMFTVGIKIAMPVLAVLFLAEVSMAFVARTVPQINVFIVGFPIRIALGLVFTGLSLPFFVYVFKGAILQLQRDLAVLLKVMA